MNGTQTIECALTIIDGHIANAPTPELADALRAKRAAEMEYHAMTLAYQADVKVGAHAWRSPARAEADRAIEASRQRLHVACCVVQGLQRVAA